ncbi:hypothetical protein A2661_01835 [Candidatus Giovannonibacteria bacterium RIFCSPHIGHO2_01_FULL_45_24]|uniref:Uncharacterized protein n=1 Tax=Candidatus Giovannonibacteria bacterium RIFCSPLOWO2_01_FULL_46_32 TaxID=1798353 RepID=A0A1F5XHB7_9BACT|nr:MAG: hypothetical protein A2661_01835 [Candidatus Giovannonibacteria bacterium RIFCSPHIGHO2_01_FULL_45_24]OGF87303.1 MAG: hypothetical protein A3B19_03710 [Candidatus Giovannonibacteria bacterium RIFCSPLOWO2_01_FULL_46_32]
MFLNPKAQGLVILWLIIAGVILIAGSAYWYYKDEIKPNAQCPEDQSYVRQVIGGWREVVPSDPEGRCVSNQIIERTF